MSFYKSFFSTVDQNRRKKILLVVKSHILGILDVRLIRDGASVSLDECVSPSSGKDDSVF